MTEGLSLELLTASSRLWGHYRRKEITYDELDKRLVKLEREYGVDQTLCSECSVRHATLTEDGFQVCATGDCLAKARKKRDVGDGIDRGWADYNDHREAVGGSGL